MRLNRVLADFPQLTEGDEGAAQRVLDRPEAGEGTESTTIRLLSVPTGGEDERDYWLVCDCGWVSHGHWEAPSVWSCDACEAKAEGRGNRRRLAEAIGRHGHRVEGERYVTRG